MKGYTKDHIKVLNAMEAIRNTPEMYIDNTETPNHLFNEIIDNAIDELEYSDSIYVTYDLDNNRITIEDRGRGIPIDKIKYKGKQIPIPVLLSTELHSSGKFTKDAYKMSVGLHGVGMVVVNALSKEFEIEVSRDGKLAIFKFENRKLVKQVVKKSKIKYTYTKVSFVPDETIFDNPHVDIDHIKSRLEVIKLYDEYKDKTIKFDIIENGNKSRVDMRTPDELISNIVGNTYFLVDHKTRDGEYIKVLFSYNNKLKRNVFGTVNVLPVHSGTHIKFVENIISNILKKEYKVNYDDMTPGLNLLVITKIIDKKFQAQTKIKLTNKMKYFVERFPIQSKIRKIIQYNKEYFDKVIKFLKNVNKSILFTSSKSNVKNINKLSNLKDCLNHDSNSELIIVEGSSAGGTLIKLRDVKSQAILLLHGKIINITNKSVKSYKENRDIKALIQAIGSESNPRYGKILIAADADPDGKHIIALVMGALSVLYPELMKSGMIYIVETPLYGVRHKKSNRFTPIYSFDELRKYDSKEYIKMRFKGLGEMDEEIKDIILDKKLRRLIRVVATDEDIAEIKRIMGTSAAKKDLLKMFGMLK